MLNQATICGHLGRDPEVRYTAGGDPIASISVATTEKWTDKASGERREQTEWHSVTIFGRLAEIAGQYLKKGSLVLVQGKIKTEKWTDKNGIERYTTKIVAATLKMLSGGNSDDSGQRAGQQRAQDRQYQATGNRPAPSFDDLDDDSIPF